MAGAILTPDDRAHFLALLRRQTNSAVHRRVNVLLLLDDGWSAVRVAEALYLDVSTIAEHRSLYERDGRSGVERLRYAGRASRLSTAQRCSLSDWITTAVPRTAQAVCAWVEASFGVSYTAHAMARLLRQLGFVFKKLKCVPAKAEAAVQKSFLDDTLKPLMRSAGPQAPLYFVDGCHPTRATPPTVGSAAVRQWS